MIIGYPALVCIIVGTALLATLVAGIAIRHLPRLRILALVLVFIAFVVGLTVWVYCHYQIMPFHVELIRGL